MPLTVSFSREQRRISPHFSVQKSTYSGRASSVVNQLVALMRVGVAQKTRVPGRVWGCARSRPAWRGAKSRHRCTAAKAQAPVRSASATTSSINRSAPRSLNAVSRMCFPFPSSPLLLFSSLQFLQAGRRARSRGPSPPDPDSVPKSRLRRSPSPSPRRPASRSQPTRRWP